MHAHHRSVGVASHLVLALGIAVAGWLTTPKVAHAMCVAPAPKLLWSYPADGDRDVPTDAVFWLLSNTGSAPGEVTLDGSPLEVSHAFAAATVDPGMLEADTDYVLHLEFAPIDDGELDADNRGVDIAFRTGSAQAKVPAATLIAGHHRTSGIPPTHPCRDIIQAQGCFDTGQNTLFEFEAASDDAIAWVIKSERGQALWPARCGDPALFTYGDMPFGCVDISALGEDGKLSPRAHYCVPEAASAPAALVEDPDEGCSVSPSAASAARSWLWPLLALYAIAWRARRKR